MTRIRVYAVCDRFGALIYTVRTVDRIYWIYVRHAGNYPTWRLIECGVEGCAGILCQCI
jgi:hypothetical protein